MLNHKVIKKIMHVLILCKFLFSNFFAQYDRYFFFQVIVQIVWRNAVMLLWVTLFQLLFIHTAFLEGQHARGKFEGVRSSLTLRDEDVCYLSHPSQKRLRFFFVRLHRLDAAVQSAITTSRRRAVLVRLPKMDAGGRASFIDTASKGRKTQDKQTRTSATGCSFQMPIDACVATSRIQLRACAHCGDEFEWFSCLDGSVESCVDWLAALRNHCCCLSTLLVLLQLVKSCARLKMRESSRRFNPHFSTFGVLWFRAVMAACF